MSIYLDELRISPEFLVDGKARITLTNGDGLPHIDEVNLFRASARKRFIADALARFPAMETAWITGEVERIAQRAAAKNEEKPTGRGGVIAPPDRRKLFDAMSEDVRLDAARMAKNPDLLKEIVGDIQNIGVAGEKVLCAAIYMIGTSRLLERPLAGIIQGPSSSGKSYLYETVATLFPAETIIHAKQMTPQALFHMEEGALVHRWIVGGERSRKEDNNTAETSRALREMISSGTLTKLMPEKDDHGHIVTRQIIQPGPIAYIESTTLSDIFDEDVNRCLLLQTDEREAQTRLILMKAATSHRAAETELIVLKHHAFQRMLQSVRVTIPYAAAIGRLFPADCVEARRGINHLLNLICASTLLHQFQRATGGDDSVIASMDDYLIAKHLAEVPLGRLLGFRVSDAAMRMLEKLDKHFRAGEDFSAADIKTKLNRRTVKNYLYELRDSGHVEISEAGRGNKATLWKRTAKAASEAVSVLPDEKLLLEFGPPQFQQTPNAAQVPINTGVTT